MVSLIIIGIVILLAVIGGAVLTLPRIFEFAGNSTTTTTVPGQPTGMPQDLFSMDLNDIPGYIVGLGNGLLSQAGDFLTAQLKNIVPGASTVLGTIVIALIIIAILCWKTEWFTSILRAVFLIAIAVLMVALVLALLGLI